MLRVLAAALAGGVLLAWASLGWARPFTVDDLLRQESFGAVAFDPAGRWLVVEQRDAYETGARFDVGLNTGLVLSRLRVVDLGAPGAARPLVTGEDAAGLVMAGFSPSGARLAVFGWRGEAWALGVVEMATGALQWLDVAPDAPRQGRALQWLDEETLLVTALPDGAWPWRMSLARTVAGRLPAAWARAARGEAAVTAVGSGAYLGLRPRPAPKRLVRIAWATGVMAVLATGDILDLEVSPDRRRVAVLAGGADLQPRVGRPVQGAAGLALQAAGLSLVDLASGARRPVAGAEDVLTSLLSWSPDGRALLVFARGEGGL